MNQDTGWSSNGYSNIQKTPLYIIRGGAFRGGSFYDQASADDLWSGTTNSGTGAYDLNYISSGVYPANYRYRRDGFPVRCIAHFLPVLPISATY